MALKTSPLELESSNFKVINGKKTKRSSIGLANCLALFIILFLGANITNSLMVEFRLAKQSEMLKDQHNKILQEQEKLKKQIAFYKSSSGVEKLAREKLGYIKGDEIPVRYIEKK